MDRGNDLRSVADGGGHALHGAGADIANGKDAAAAGLQRQPVLRDVSTRQHVSGYELSGKWPRVGRSRPRFGISAVVTLPKGVPHRSA